MIEFGIGDRVTWREQSGKIIEIKDDRVAVLTDDGWVRITTLTTLAAMQSDLIPTSLLAR